MPIPRVNRRDRRQVDLAQPPWLQFRLLPWSAGASSPEDHFVEVFFRLPPDDADQPIQLRSLPRVDLYRDWVFVGSAIAASVPSVDVLRLEFAGDVQANDVLHFLPGQDSVSGLGQFLMVEALVQVQSTE